MTNVEALKALYVAIGGDADDVANVSLTADMIAAIATVLPKDTAYLPEVDATNNGDVLTVKEGKWQAVTPAP